MTSYIIANPSYDDNGVFVFNTENVNEFISTDNEALNEIIEELDEFVRKTGDTMGQLNTSNIVLLENGSLTFSDGSSINTAPILSYTIETTNELTTITNDLKIKTTTPPIHIHWMIRILYIMICPEYVTCK